MAAHWGIGMRTYRGAATRKSKGQVLVPYLSGEVGIVKLSVGLLEAKQIIMRETNCAWETVPTTVTSDQREGPQKYWSDILCFWLSPAAAANSARRASTRRRTVLPRNSLNLGLLVGNHSSGLRKGHLTHGNSPEIVVTSNAYPISDSGPERTQRKFA